MKDIVRIYHLKSKLLLVHKYSLDVSDAPPHRFALTYPSRRAAPDAATATRALNEDISKR